MPTKKASLVTPHTRHPLFSPRPTTPHTPHTPQNSKTMTSTTPTTSTDPDFQPTSPPTSPQQASPTKASREPPQPPSAPLKLARAREPLVDLEVPTVVKQLERQLRDAKPQKPTCVSPNCLKKGSRRECPKCKTVYNACRNPSHAFRHACPDAQKGKGTDQHALWRRSGVGGGTFSKLERI
jgi:hypothetical protein